jgi:hypothetical protein
MKKYFKTIAAVAFILLTAVALAACGGGGAPEKLAAAAALPTECGRVFVDASEGGFALELIGDFSFDVAEKGRYILYSDQTGVLEQGSFTYRYEKDSLDKGAFKFRKKGGDEILDAAFYINDVFEGETLRDTIVARWYVGGRFVNLKLKNSLTGGKPAYVYQKYVGLYSNQTPDGLIMLSIGQNKAYTITKPDKTKSAGTFYVQGGKLWLGAEGGAAVSGAISFVAGNGGEGRYKFNINIAYKQGSVALDYTYTELLGSFEASAWIGTERVELTLEFSYDGTFILYSTSERSGSNQVRGNGTFALENAGDAIKMTLTQGDIEAAKALGNGYLTTILTISTEGEINETDFSGVTALSTEGDIEYTVTFSFILKALEGVTAPIVFTPTA